MQIIAMEVPILASKKVMKKKSDLDSPLDKLSEDLDELCRRATVLKQLLDDRHPGLFTWCEAFKKAALDLYAELDEYQWIRWLHKDAEK